MIIFRYLIKEVVKTQLAVFIVLMAIFLSQKFVRVLADASDGGIPGQLVMTFIGLSIPSLSGIILPLSLFLGILLAYGRIYADSEMSILHACGISEWYVTRVTLIVALLTALATGAVTLYLAPFAADYEYKVKERLSADSGLTSLIAGRFQQTGNEKAVVFVHEKNREGNELGRIFLALIPELGSSDNKIINASLVYANKGSVIEEESGSQMLVLENGYRYQSNAQTNEYQSVEFGRYQIQIQDQKVEQKRRKISALSNEQLLADESPENIAELQWRISLPISVIILTLIAVPLSTVNPRQGKFAKMLPALLLFLGYFLLLSSARSALEDGKYPTIIGLWPIHISALIMGWLLLLNNRIIGYKLKAKLKWRSE